MKFLSNFKRVTSSGSYIPEIDGLRFIAIMSVILYHIRGVFVAFSKRHPYAVPLNNSILYRFLDNGNQGVEIFFAISGFILALPFIKQFRYGGKQMKLSSFYMRRVTRLEPPYIIAMIILFFGVLAKGEYNFKELFPSLLASLVYLHGIIFHELPKVTTVAWSLEVEVQFYLITPLLMRLFLLPKNVTRIIWVLLICVIPFFQNLFPASVNTLYKFLQYFAAGILFADFYLDKEFFLHKLNGAIFFMCGCLLLALLFGLNANISATESSHVENTRDFLIKLIYPFIILCFFMISAGNNWWKKILSVNLVVVIGGMCYSIYLLHTAILTFFSVYIMKHHFTGNAVADYLISAVILLIPVIIISSVFFILIEKPCMKPYWYREIKFKKAKPF